MLIKSDILMAAIRLLGVTIFINPAKAINMKK
jgi:hypothetical protein